MARAWLRIRISFLAGWVIGAGWISRLDLGESKKAALFSMFVSVDCNLQS